MTFHSLLDQIILFYILHLWIFEMILILQHLWEPTQIQHMEQLAHVQNMQQQIIKNIRIKRKRSSMFMHVIEAFDNNNKVIIDAMDWINTS